MVGWHHQLNENELEQASGVGDGLGSLVCCTPWGHKESDMTERLNRTETFHESHKIFLKFSFSFFSKNKIDC